MTLPLTSVDNERGFSMMKLIKTPHRNRLLDETLSALMNVTINGPSELPDEDALEIASVWLEKKPRRKVTERGRKNVAKMEEQRAARKRQKAERKQQQDLGQQPVAENVESDSDDENNFHGIQDVADAALANASAMDLDVEKFLY